MTERQKTFSVVLPKKNFQYPWQPQQIYVTLRLFPPACSSLASVFSLLSAQGVFFETSETECLIEGSQVRLRRGCRTLSLLSAPSEANTQARIHTSSSFHLCTGHCIMYSPLTLKLCQWSNSTLNCGAQQKAPALIVEWVFCTQYIANRSAHVHTHTHTQNPKQMSGSG